MKRRPAVTLMEVLIAMFIMAIGMLALLALFPVGAASMAQALKDDRCAYASIMSENVAIATNVRYGDMYVNWAINNPPNPLRPALVNQFVSQSGLVYVDPYKVFADAAAGLSLNTPYGLTLSASIPRIAPSFVYSPPPAAPLIVGPTPGTIPSPALIDRWFSLPDDIGFNLSGTPDTSNTGGVIDRGRRYTYAYLLRRQPPLPSPINLMPQSPKYAVQLFAVVYAGRPINSLATTITEWSVPAAPTPPNSLLVAGANSAIAQAHAKRGGWILDSTLGNFYRITNIAEIGGNTVLETQQNLQVVAGQPTMNIILMDYVAEVFDKGFGWQQ
jgi:hypothetical protein